MCFTRTYTGKSRWGKVDFSPINFSPILKHTGVNSFPGFTLVLRPIATYNETNETASGRSGSQRPSARRRLPDAVWQMPRLADADGRRPLPDAVSFYVAIGLSTRVKPGNEAILCVLRWGKS